MHVRERLIRECFATQQCEGCGSAYGLGTVLVLARRPAAWLVLAACGQCEHRCIYVVSFPDGAHTGERAYQRPTLAPLDGPATHLLGEELAEGRTPDGPITADEVAAMRAFLADFDGDFRRLFAGDGPPNE